MLPLSVGFIFKIQNHLFRIQKADKWIGYNSETLNYFNLDNITFDFQSFL
jgi:hypothetical protein